MAFTSGFGLPGPTNWMLESEFESHVDTGSSGFCWTPGLQSCGISPAPNGLLPYPVRYKLPGCSQYANGSLLNLSIVVCAVRVAPNAPNPPPMMVDVNPPSM